MTVGEGGDIKCWAEVQPVLAQSKWPMPKDPVSELSHTPSGGTFHIEGWVELGAGEIAPSVKCLPCDHENLRPRDP